MRRAMLVIGFAAFIFALSTVGCVEMSTKYGMFVLDSPSGERFFFRREARGLNHDTLSITRNSNACRQPDPMTDIIFVDSGTVLFYKISGNQINIYVNSLPKMPTKFSDFTDVSFHSINNGEFLNLTENYQRMGFEKIEVRLDDSLTCR